MAIELLEEEIRTVGRIFGVSDRAEQLDAELRGVLDGVEKKVGEADLPKAFGDVSFEQVAERAPEVIVIYDYGDQPVAGKEKFLLGNPALKDAPAIRKQRFAVLPLSSTLLGVRAPEGVASLAGQLHPDLVS